MTSTTVGPTFSSRVTSVTGSWAATRPTETSVQAVPMLGCPAKGSSMAGVKMRTRASPPASGAVTKVVSERFISVAICCIDSSLSPSASGKTASGLPANGRSLNTSTWIMRRLFTVS